MALDTRYRPTTYADVLGQRGTVAILRQFVKTGAGFHQSYLFAGPFGSGKCVTGDTLVPTAKGLVPILSLMGPNTVDPISAQVVQEGRNLAQAAFSYRGGYRQTVRITTRYGYSIEGTPNHRIRVMQPNGVVDWSELGSIKVGDQACIVPYGIFGSGADLSGFAYPVQRTSGSFKAAPVETPSSLTPEWGRLLGYLVGDGSCKSKEGLVLSCADLEIKQDQLSLLGKLTGSARETPDKRSSTGLSTLRSSRKQARAFAAFAGLGYVGAADKEVPWSILASPEPIVREFLRGYMEADGHVSKSGIEVTTKSKRLAQQVQCLFLQFGIVSRLSSKKHKKHGDYWRLAVLAPWWEAYVTKVGFVSARKQKSAELLLAGPLRQQGSKRTLTNIREVVPFQRVWISRFYQNLPKAVRSPATDRLFQCRTKSSKNSCTTRQVFSITGQFRDYDPEGHFSTLVSQGYFYDPVVSVVEGAAEVYDLTVPEGEMFAANGFMNHNTTLARILARALLCEAPVDGGPCDTCASCQSMLETGSSENFVEVDAATNSGKADVKKITDEIGYSTFSGRRRIYLLDEAHRLSADALDALLKPLEETIGNTQDKRLVCLFCTTEPERMKATILSRCAPAFFIETVKPETVAERLAKVCEAEGIPYEQEALVLIAERTECHIRDCLKAVEGVSMLGGVTLDTVKSYLHLDLNQSYLDLLLSLGGESFAPASAVLRHLQGKASPLTCYERLAELCLMAYKFHAGLDTNPPSYWDRQALSQAGSKHGARLVELAAFFSSKPSKASFAALECDLLMAHGGRTFVAPALAAPVSSAQVVPVTQSPVTQSPVTQTRVAPSPTIPSPKIATQGSLPVATVVGGVKVDPRAQRRVDATPQPSGLEMPIKEFGGMVARMLAELTWTNGTSKHG